MTTEVPPYTRWPKFWPSEMLSHITWPPVMQNIFPFPYHFLIANQELGPGLPEPPERFALATFKTFNGLFWIWDIEPSIVGPQTQSFLQCRLVFAGNTPFAFRWGMSFSGLPNLSFQGDTKDLDFAKDNDPTYAPQAPDIEFFIANIFNFERSFSSFALKPRKCQLWPPPE